MGDFAVVPAGEYGESPRESGDYPGDKPGFSYFLHDGSVHELRLFGRVGDSRLTFGDKTRVLSEILDELGLGALEDWYGVMAHGSNACPPQLVYKGFKDVVAVKARMFGIRAVYANYYTKKYYPATLARAKGQEYETWVTLLQDTDLKSMDDSENRGKLYHLVKVNEGKLFLENGKEVKDIYAYVIADDKGLFLREGQPIGLDEVVEQEKFKKLARSGKLTHSASSSWLNYEILKGTLPKTWGEII